MGEIGPPAFEATTRDMHDHTEHWLEKAHPMWYTRNSVFGMQAVYHKRQFKTGECHVVVLTGNHQTIWVGPPTTPTAATDARIHTHTHTHPHTSVRALARRTRASAHARLPAPGGNARECACMPMHRLAGLNTITREITILIRPVLSGFMCWDHWQHSARSPES